MEGCRVALLGMMGSGKTTVGRLLSDATGWPRYDNDALLRELYGQTPKEILEQRGAEALRSAEDAALAVGLAKSPPSIVDVAAGTILSASTRERLRRVTSVWLTASPETLYTRAVGAVHRPWLEGGEQWVRETLEQRAPLYASVANVVVDTDERSPADVAYDILSRLAKICPGISRPAP